MARGKKKENALTSEEKLAQALVPDWEQPYKVPKNWCWTKQGLVSSFLNGRAYKQPELLEDDTLTPVLRVGNLFTNSSWYYSDLVLEENKYIDDNDLIYAWSASFGPFIWQGGRVIYHYHIWKIQLSTCLNKKFYYYWLMNDTERLKVSGHGTGMIHITKEMMELSSIPLPPLREQQRIVDRIESLFAKLDEAKEKAQSVLDSFETRKAAILHQAFTGELTAKWRAEHSVHADTWKCTTLSNVVSGFKYGSSEKSAYNNQGMPVLRIPNIGDNGVDFSDLKYLTHNDVEEESQIHEGDILIIRSNGSRDLVGKSVLVPPLDQPYAYASFLIRIKPSAAVNAEYLTKYLNSADARSQMFRKAKSSAGINNINSKELGAISLTLPTVPEQTEIARILDRLFAKEQQAKEAAEAVLEKIDLLKKSILARAFRGELGTNAPTEESAIELLKRIGNTPNESKIPVKRILIPEDLNSRLKTELERKIIKLFVQYDAVSLPTKQIMTISSNKFDIMDALRALQQRGVLCRENDTYKLLR